MNKTEKMIKCFACK